MKKKSLSKGMSETPNEYLRKSLKQSEEDINTGRVTSFESGKDALEYLTKEIENEKK